MPRVFSPRPCVPRISAASDVDCLYDYTEGKVCFITLHKRHPAPPRGHPMSLTSEERSMPFCNRKACTRTIAHHLIFLSSYFLSSSLPPTDFFFQPEVVSFLSAVRIFRMVLRGSTALENSRHKSGFPCREKGTKKAAPRLSELLRLRGVQSLRELPMRRFLPREFSNVRTDVPIFDTKRSSSAGGV